jgi:Beta-ketoacyl synthase, N-terminal domain
MMNAKEDSIGKIAIIGMSGRFPNAKSLDQFWDSLHNGVEAISPFDITRTLRVHAYPETLPLLAQFLEDENVGSEARAFLAEIVGNDLGSDIKAWLDWFNRRKSKEGKK